MSWTFYVLNLSFIVTLTILVYFGQIEGHGGRILVKNLGEFIVYDFSFGLLHEKLQISHLINCQSVIKLFIQVKFVNNTRDNFLH